MERSLLISTPVLIPGLTEPCDFCTSMPVHGEGGRGRGELRNAFWKRCSLSLT